MLFTYGPYMRDGRHTAPSNEAFDASLKARDSRWGVRDVADVEAAARENGIAAARNRGNAGEQFVAGVRKATLVE